MNLLAQDSTSTKGSKVLSKPGINPDGASRAVVFGISDYKDTSITDLKYAHKDAIAFIEFLKGDIGGKLPEEQWDLHYDSTATTAQLAHSLDWLYNESKAGDLAVIYFSGHSDVETKFRTQAGYLLTHDSPSEVYAAGAFSMTVLNQYIEAMSNNDVKVVMISDACHSGTLAGTELGGREAATASLAQRYYNEIKVLSCQPKELSIEGPQWGGGRGVFSYFLIEGLTGNADTDNDSAINVKEIGRYLQDKVGAEDLPSVQTPNTSGDLNEILASISKNLKESQQLANSESLKSLEDRVLGSLEASLAETYSLFKGALEADELMEPAGSSANDYYITLSSNPDLKELHDHMRRALAAALQDQIQRERNKLLESLLSDD
jgi:hypothetical protein